MEGTQPLAGSQIARMLLEQLESLRRAGVTHMARPKAAQPAKLAASAPVKTAPPIQAVSPKSTKTPPKQPPSDPADPQAAALAEIAQKVSGCVLCEELARTRTQTVFGDGSPHARLVFMGEAPGRDEDLQGIPFVGQAGKLLNKIIEACGLRDPRSISSTR